MEIVHILTVGTSLLTNNGGSKRDVTEYPNAVWQLNQECDTVEQLAEMHGFDNLLAMQKNHVLTALNALDPFVELNFREPPKKHNRPTDRLPQEVSYLGLHWLEKSEPEARCYLLASDTTLGKFCAAVIHDYVNQRAELNPYYHIAQWEPIPGVDASNAEAFEKDGFRNLMDKVHEIIEKHKGISKIYLNLTGGFKGLLSYGTLQGMLYASGQITPQVTLCYLFEETPKIIYMPSYPIGLNFHHWHRNATRLRMVLRGEESFKETLSKEMRNLLKPGTNELFSLGQHLKEEYRLQLSEDPLKIYSREIIQRLLPNCLGEEAQKLRMILENLIKQVGDLLWVGDKIPEMVDHALKHHQHLLEFAELFLTPILAKDRSFMNSKERFCLLAGILLHDCGHSLDYLKSETMQTTHEKIPLFPSDVRDYHHFLTDDRLDDPQTAQELAWPGRDGFKEKGLDEDLHDAVRTVCLYHRRRTGYERYDSPKQEAKAKNHLTGKALPSLFQNPVTSRLKTQGIDLMKVVAFIRLIDGCDVQSRRAGSPQFVEQKRQVLNRDYQIAQGRAHEAVALYCETLHARKEAVKACGKSTEFELLTRSIEKFTLDDSERQARLTCRDLRKNDDAEIRLLAQLWLIAAELVDRADMKSKQHEHYLKHQCVQEVLVFPASVEEGRREFDVVLVPEPALYEQLNEHLEEEGKTRRKLIEDEISSEYGSVQQYATREYRLRVTYWWQEAYNARPAGAPFSGHPENHSDERKRC